MPKKRLWFFLGALLLLAVYGTFSISAITEESHEEYEELFSYTPHFPGNVEQEKTHIRKDIWINKGGHRYHHAIISPWSRVKIVDFQPQIRVEETFPHLECYLQEEIEGSFDSGYTQELRLFEATSGLYDYQKQTFLAHQVNFADYQVQGNQLPIKDTLPQPFLAGRASSALLKFEDHTIQAKANHVQATVFQPKKKSAS